jgi:hypothetical protein
MLRELKLAIAVILEATIAASLASRANAQEGAVSANVRQACGGDLRSFCSDITPGGGCIK